MDVGYAQTPHELRFPPQSPFSWTLRWARAHGPTPGGRSCPAGSAHRPEELASAIAFARKNEARIEID